jgi:hypothetical protein
LKLGGLRSGLTELSIELRLLILHDHVHIDQWLRRLHQQLLGLLLFQGSSSSLFILSLLLFQGSVILLTFIGLLFVALLLVLGHDVLQVLRDLLLLAFLFVLLFNSRQVLSNLLLLWARLFGRTCRCWLLAWLGSAAFHWGLLLGLLVWSLLGRACSALGATWERSVQAAFYRFDEVALHVPDFALAWLEAFCVQAAFEGALEGAEHAANLDVVIRPPRELTFRHNAINEISVILKAINQF